MRGPSFRLWSSPGGMTTDRRHKKVPKMLWQLDQHEYRVNIYVKSFKVVEMVFAIFPLWTGYDRKVFIHAFVHENCINRAPW